MALIRSSLGSGHGTETALAALQDDLLREADKGKMSFLVLLNLSVAFDTIEHQRPPGVGSLGWRRVAWTTIKEYSLGR